MSNKQEIRQRALSSGRDVAIQYRELLQMVMVNLTKPSGETKSNLSVISRNIAQSVTDLAAAAEMLKDDDWVDPADPTFIAENELLGAAKSIENAAKKLASFQLCSPRQLAATKNSHCRQSWRPSHDDLKEASHCLSPYSPRGRTTLDRGSSLTLKIKY